MRNFYNLVLCSSKELKSVKNLTVASLLITMKLILDLFTIQLNQALHLSFEFLPFASLSMLFGPVTGAMCGALSDIINYIMNPKGAFFPGFTISAMVSGIIYGITFYKKQVTIARCIVAEIAIVVIVDLLLNTFWLSLLYGKGFFVLLPMRMIKNFVMIPIKVAMMYFVLK
ncbi:MAG TPA: folate family ECF transporter S component [Clostridium sp.]|nr:folate family ECF transporter S component [Clostridium sp.]